MIFKTKKAFEEEVFNRMSEIRFKSETENEIYRLKDEVRELKYRLEMLEHSVRQPVAMPYPTTNTGTVEATTTIN